MKELEELYTVQDVDARIDEICRHDPGLRSRAESSVPSACNGESDMKLDAVRAALARRGQLEEEIASGFRAPDGILNVSV